jgi:hypothetical protein
MPAQIPSRSGGTAERRLGRSLLIVRPPSAQSPSSQERRCCSASIFKRLSRKKTSAAEATWHGRLHQNAPQSDLADRRQHWAVPRFGWRSARPKPRAPGQAVGKATPRSPWPRSRGRQQTTPHPRAGGRNKGTRRAQAESNQGSNGDRAEPRHAHSRASTARSNPQRVPCGALLAICYICRRAPAGVRALNTAQSL